MFPSRVGSGPLEGLTVRQLRTALAGPHGYVKTTAFKEPTAEPESVEGAKEPVQGIEPADEEDHDQASSHRRRRWRSFPSSHGRL